MCGDENALHNSHTHIPYSLHVRGNEDAWKSVRVNSGLLHKLNVKRQGDVAEGG